MRCFLRKEVMVMPYKIRRTKKYSRIWEIYDERTGVVVGHSVPPDAKRKAGISARIRNRYDKKR